MRSRMSHPQIQAEPNPEFSKPKLKQDGLEAVAEAGLKDWACYQPASKLTGKVALITGGDAGIGRAVAELYAREGADVAIACLPGERVGADETRRRIEAEGRRCLTCEGDSTSADSCLRVVDRTVAELGRIDILVNAAHQNCRREISHAYTYYRLVRAALPHLRRGAAIIVTGSETGFEGHETLHDCSIAKGAVHDLTKSLAKMLSARGIRVNGVAPGVARRAQPEELAPAYVFLASDADSSSITGEVFAVMGGAEAVG
jgi:NAD(P)-dependent dehydrogenase (short-subunit alcohol dehydrogenase family)